MGLYNVLFGTNPVAPVLLACLNLKASDVPRFRDCYIDGEHIVIHTRTGGGNREYYDSLDSCKGNYPEYFSGENDPCGPWNSDLQAHPLYLFDKDDDFDRTYADFHFKFPDEYRAELEAISKNNTELKPSEKWQKLFADLKAAT